MCAGEFDSPTVDVLEQTRAPENRAHTLTFPKLAVDQVADETMAGIDCGEEMIVSGTKTRLVVADTRYAPFIAKTIVEKRIKAVYQGLKGGCPQNIAMKVGDSSCRLRSTGR